MRQGAILVALLAVAHGVAPSPLRAQEPYDIVIRGGRLLDGSGNPWYYGDVGIRGDRIVAVGNLADAAARRTIDATGQYVAPGFIDAHTHAGGGLARPELSHARPLLAQGITTVIINPDGQGPVDLVAQRETLERNGIGVNAAQLIGHGSVRQAVLGMDDRAPSAAEIDRMRALVRAGMEAGAFGLSSGPYYAPGSYATTAELVAVAGIAAEYGGAYTSHIRDEADYSIGVVAALDEVITVAREARLPSVATHLKALGPRVWGFGPALVKRIERARAEGLEVFADQYPYTASATGLTAALVPRWAQAGGDDALLPIPARERGSAPRWSRTSSGGAAPSGSSSARTTPTPPSKDGPSPRWRRPVGRIRWTPRSRSSRRAGPAWSRSTWTKATSSS
jgi:N-acyl-D-amino-acid deacylase